jgi:phage-related protein
MFVRASAGVDLGAQATYYAYGVEEISLPGLTLRPGDELVIDTDLMTVTLNGVNIARYVSMNSQFIRLLANSNTLVYQDASGQTRKATVRVEWKPRWL